MSQQLVIDNIQFASQGSLLEGDLNLLGSSRLADALAGADSPVHYIVRGHSGDRGELLIDLAISGTVALCCQRCLQPFDFDLDVDATFELRESLNDDVLMQEDLEDDSRDYLSVSRSMDLVSLIEDEVLLALPPVPKHESCVPPDMRHDPEAASPFGVLLHLKGQSGKTH